MLAALLELIPAPDRSRGALLWISALFSSQSGDQSTATRMATEALAIGRATSDPELVGWSLQGLGVAAYLEGRWDDTIAYGTESINLARTMALPFLALSATVLLAVGRTFRGELDEGIALATDGLRLSETLGETWQRATLLQFLAVATLHRNEPAEAERHARRCLELKRDLGDLTGMAQAMEALASIAMALNAGERAATLLGAADAMWRSIPTSILEPLRADHDRAVSDARSALGAVRFDAALGAGMSMTRDEVVDYVVEARRPAARPVVAPVADGPLSRREMEVAELIADGATNAQVAARLFISERTVESHVASIFNKLGVDTRLQVARWFASTQVTETV